MKAVNILTFILIFLSFAILMGAGHGAVPVGLLELIAIPVYFTADGIFDDASVFFLFLSLVGHLLLVVALFSKKKLKKTVFILTGESCILSTIIFFTRDYRTNEAAKFMLGWSIPAMVSMVVLTLYLFFSKKMMKVFNEGIVKKI
jgi:hypothetical protein